MDLALREGRGLDDDQRNTSLAALHRPGCAYDKRGQVIGTMWRTNRTSVDRLTHRSPIQISIA